MKVIRYSHAFKLQAVREVESGKLCSVEVERKYNITGNGTVTRWVRQFGSGKYGKMIRVEKPDEINQTTRLRSDLCAFRLIRTPIPKLIGHLSGIIGQLSERSDALRRLIRGCPNWVKFFPPLFRSEATCFPRRVAGPDSSCCEPARPSPNGVAPTGAGLPNLSSRPLSCAWDPFGGGRVGGRPPP